MNQQQAQELKRLADESSDLWIDYGQGVPESRGKALEARAALHAFIDRLSADSVGAEAVAVAPTFEHYVALREGHCNGVIDKYFEARRDWTLMPHGIFKDAFYRGFDARDALSNSPALVVAAPSPAPAVPSDLRVRAINAGGHRTYRYPESSDELWILSIEQLRAFAASQQPAATSEPISDKALIAEYYRRLDENVYDRLCAQVFIDGARFALAHQPAAAEPVAWLFTSEPNPHRAALIRAAAELAEVRTWGYALTGAESSELDNKALRLATEFKREADSLPIRVALAHQPAASQEGDGK